MQCDFTTHEAEKWRGVIRYIACETVYPSKERHFPTCLCRMPHVDEWQVSGCDQWGGFWEKNKEMKGCWLSS